MAYLFMAFEPLAGWRATSVRERRRGLQFAEEVRWLVEEVSTRRPRGSGWSWTTSPPTRRAPSTGPSRPSAVAQGRVRLDADARFVAEHGVEVELSLLARQCLGKRGIPDAETLAHEAGAWAEERNRLGASVNWRFTTPDARTKLRKLYPSIEH
jgi:hypothetical protein